MTMTRYIPVEASKPPSMPHLRSSDSLRERRRRVQSNPANTRHVLHCTPRSQILTTLSALDTFLLRRRNPHPCHTQRGLTAHSVNGGVEYRAIRLILGTPRSRITLSTLNTSLLRR